ncbi:MAG: hypothetical protein ACYTXA_22900 [Nostoc sp.]
MNWNLFKICSILLTPDIDFLERSPSLSIILSLEFSYELPRSLSFPL